MWNLNSILNQNALLDKGIVSFFERIKRIRKFNSKFIIRYQKKSNIVFYLLPIVKKHWAFPKCFHQI